MLVLFKPWRTAADLKDIDQSWSDAFESYDFDSDLRLIMHNMNVQNECRDARNTAGDQERLSGKQALPYLSGHPEYSAADYENENPEGLSDALMCDSNLDDASDVDEDDSPDADAADLITDLNPAMNEVRSAINILRQTEHTTETVCPSSLPFGEATSDDLDLIQVQQKYMKDDKAKGRAQLESTLTSETFPFNNETTAASVEVETIGDFTIQHHYSPNLGTEADPLIVIEQIIDECGIRGNMEQERAFRIVAEHFLSGNREQLLMYLGGVGGTGKSYVIKAIIQLFERCRAFDALLLSAPTGIAAVLISGRTIHSLTLLPKTSKKTNVSLLTAIWQDTRWLILDEISMVSAQLLSQISHQISLAKGSDTTVADKPFGGINVLFAGDFGQLKPVRLASLFKYDLVNRISANTAQTIAGQTNMHGAYLWRQVNRHVQLRVNWRHRTDPRYSNLLSHIRLGSAWRARHPHTQDQRGEGPNYTLPDYDMLLSRTLETLARQDNSSISDFHDAPFIVTRKVVRDAINEYKVRQFARATGQEVMLFAALDRIGRRDATRDEQERLRRLNSTCSKDSLGILSLVPGMKVMVTENVSINQSAVNGAEGKLVHVKYRTDAFGDKIPLCAYVRIPGARIEIETGFPLDVVPIFPTPTRFEYLSHTHGKYTISRSQLSILPAYAYTDYKSQGRTLKRAIVDLIGCGSLQSMYVMLSRVQSLDGLAVLRWFDSNKLYNNLQEEFRTEFARLRAPPGYLICCA